MSENQVAPKRRGRPFGSTNVVTKAVVGETAALLAAGNTIAQVARRRGVSRQSVHQLVEKHSLKVLVRRRRLGDTTRADT